MRCCNSLIWGPEAKCSDDQALNTKQTVHKRFFHHVSCIQSIFWLYSYYHYTNRLMKLAACQSTCHVCGSPGYFPLSYWGFFCMLNKFQINICFLNLSHSVSCPARDFFCRTQWTSCYCWCKTGWWAWPKEWNSY